jgi:hypothetical protein
VATTLFREARAVPPAPPVRRPDQSTVEMSAIDPAELVSAERTPPGGSRL